MNDSLTITIIIHGPAYRELLVELLAVKNPRNRASLLRRLAEDGKAISDSHQEVISKSARLSDDSDSNADKLDMRLVIRSEEFPCLHAELLQFKDARARAARLRQLAYKGARRRHIVISRDIPQPSATPISIGPEGEQTKSITGFALDPGSLPKDLFAGFE
jgi:hypothetical protein